MLPSVGCAVADSVRSGAASIHAPLNSRCFESGFNLSRERGRMMQMKYLVVPLALIALALSATGARAQVSTTGSVTVTIEDQDNARVPGVTVTAAATDAVSRRSAVTDAEGNATLDGLAPSALYRITAELSGFKNLVRENILVRSGQTTTL